MPKPSKFKQAKGPTRKETKRPAAAIETIADVISIDPSDEPLDMDSRQKASKRQKTSHIPSATSQAPGQHERANHMRGAMSGASSKSRTVPGMRSTGSETAPIVIPDPNPPDAYTVLPKHLADTMREAYDVHPTTIHNSSKISKCVTDVLGKLENGFSLKEMDQKPGVVALTAKAGAANKLVTVAELTKRTLQDKKMRWFQYTGVGGWLGQLEEKGSKKSKENARDKNWKEKGKGRTLDGNERLQDEDGDLDMEGTAAEPVLLDDDDDDDDEASFETMASPGEKRHRVREVPVLTIYLSRVPVPQLKAEYGEQSHDPRKPLAAE